MKQLYQNTKNPPKEANNLSIGWGGKSSIALHFCKMFYNTNPIMGKDVLHYLSPREAQSIQRWAVNLEPLKERHPLLTKVDLVVEGGVGNGRTMTHIVRRLFPDALYVGMDISEMLAGGRKYLCRRIDEEILQQLVEANQHPSLYMEGAIFMANCFDYDLIRDIAVKTGRRVPLLVSYNSLAAFIDKKMNPWETKSDKDKISIGGIASFQSPFLAQLHMNNDDKLWAEEENPDGLRVNFQELEEGARTNGWITDRFNYGLVLLKE